MDEHPSQTAAAVDAMLRTQGYNLPDWLADQLDARESHRRIAELLADRSDGAVNVSYETIRRWVNWYGDRAAA